MRKKNNVKSNRSSKNINKSTVEQRASKSEKATVGIEFVKQTVDILKPWELSESQRLKTFQLMMLDDSVYDAFTTNAMLVEKSFSNYSIEFDETSERSKQARDFLQWNLNHLEGQSVRSIARSAIEFKRDGLAPFEKIFERAYDEWATTPDGISAYKIKKLNYISPLTLYEREPFVIREGNKITEMRQSTNAFKDSGNLLSTRISNPLGYISIPMSKVLLTTYSATDAQPFGRSPFEACYTAWREKILLQDLTSVGVSKDLAGMPLILMPSAMLNEAEADPTSDAGRSLAQIKENLANLHTGDQASMIMPSNTFNDAGSGAKEYEVKFLGIEGSGKSFDLEALVEQRRKFIYSVFGASNLISNDSSGGYNQLEGQTNLQYHFIERDNSVIEETLWNRDLIPQLFRLNEWKLSFEELPKIRAGDISPTSLDELGKWAQRLASGGLFPKAPEALNELYKKSGMKYQVPKDTPQDELNAILGAMTTKAGEGMKEGLPSGTGSASGNNSAVNSNNAS